MTVHDLALEPTEVLEALSAIRRGEVDALVVSTAHGSPAVVVLKGADRAQGALLETLNEGAAMIDPDMGILYANGRIAELFGRPREEILGASLGGFFAPEDAPALAAMLAERAGKRELSVLNAAGERVQVMVSLRAVGSGHDTFTVVVSDLTALKAAQWALLRYNDELEAKVRERTAELEAANAALRAEVAERARLGEALERKAEELLLADRRKDEFLSMLAHELRNPLSPILTSVEMLRAAGAMVPEVAKHRAVIERQAKNLMRLVDDLLDVSRITRGAITLRRQRIDLATLTQSAFDAVRPLMDARGHALTTRLPDEPTPLFVDPTRLEQVLVNLLNNAAKYTPRDGRVELTAERRGDQIEIRVRDSGVGISADLLPHVFDLFVQGERSLDRAQGGLGIGLTLVKSLVEMHGGAVEARSAGPGRGSELIVLLPLAREDQGAREDGDVLMGSPEHEDPGPPERRILVVEDHVDTAESITELLQQWGFRVQMVDSGAAALRALTEFRPHAALVDVGLPGMDGYEVARRVRRSEVPGERMLLIGISGYGQERDRRAGIDAGFDHYIVKPPNLDKLQQILESALEGPPG